MLKIGWLRYYFLLEFLSCSGICSWLVIIGFFFINKIYFCFLFIYSKYILLLILYNYSNCVFVYIFEKIIRVYIKRCLFISFFNIDKCYGLFLVNRIGW